MREIFRVQDPAGCTQQNRASVIVLDHLRMGVSASAVINRIQMRDKADGLSVLISL